MVSVVLAFLRVSSRKAITPLLTASTPVMAVQPEENTFSSSHQLTAAVAAGNAGSGVTGCGCPAACSTCHAPTRDHNQQRSRKQVSGNHEHHAGVVHAAHVHDGQNGQHSRHSSSVCGCKAGTAEISAPTPAEMPTAAVRM